MPTIFFTVVALLLSIPLMDAGLKHLKAILATRRAAKSFDKLKAAIPMRPSAVAAAVQASPTGKWHTNDGYSADGMVVLDLPGGHATMIVRERSVKGVSTGQLIVWTGKKRKKGARCQGDHNGKAMRYQDSYYDLGVVQAPTFGDDVVAEFLKMAQAQMNSLKPAPKSKQASVAAPVVPAEPQATPAVEVAVAPQQASESVPVVSVEDNQQPEPAIKMKRFPSVSRGVILEMGIMPRTSGGEEFDCYGVRLKTDEGIEDVVWGVNLKTALREAKAGIGERVEILKVGRKTMEKGKAPMNLYQATKLQ